MRWDAGMQKQNRGVGVLQYDQKYRQPAKSTPDRPNIRLSVGDGIESVKKKKCAPPLFLALFVFCQAHMTSSLRKPITVPSALDSKPPVRRTLVCRPTRSRGVGGLLSRNE